MPRPIFRVFNPVLQSQKFDPRGEYLRRWRPELARLPDAALHAPWLAQPQTLEQAGLRLGQHYPQPIISLSTSRERALAAYRRLRTDG
jgi:deoxyribodipyrimidine photo-lyase